METKQMVTVRTHLYHDDQLKGLSGSSGPFQLCMILPSSVALSAPGMSAGWPPCSDAGFSSTSAVFLPALLPDHDVRPGSPVGIVSCDVSDHRGYDLAYQAFVAPANDGQRVPASQCLVPP